MPMVARHSDSDTAVWVPHAETIGLLLVLADALAECRDVRELVQQIAAIDPPDVRPLQDGCEECEPKCGPKLSDELDKQPHCILAQIAGDYGYGEHSYSCIIVLADGRVISASCGGCSCGGSGDWRFEDTPYDAMLNIPEDQRELFLGVIPPSDFTPE